MGMCFILTSILHNRSIFFLLFILLLIFLPVKKALCHLNTTNLKKWKWGQNMLSAGNLRIDTESNTDLACLQSRRSSFRWKLMQYVLHFFVLLVTFPQTSIYLGRKVIAAITLKSL